MTTQSVTNFIVRVQPADAPPGGKPSELLDRAGPDKGFGGATGHASRTQAREQIPQRRERSPGQPPRFVVYCAAREEDGSGEVLADAFNMAQADADGPALAAWLANTLDGEVIFAVVDMRRQRRDAEALGLFQHHMWREVADRLGGEEGGEIVGRIVRLEPGGLVDGAGELGGV
jgi:hypothetical protein